MADESTTASTQTTETTETQGTTPETGSTSTTEKTADQTTETTSTDEGDKTLLTEKTADTEADATVDGTGKKDGEDGADKDADTEKPENAELFGAPEGDYELELPDDTVVDKDALAAVTPVAKKLGLSNKGLSEIAGVYQNEVLPKVIDGLNEQLERNIAATHAQWKEEATTLVAEDPVFDKQPMAEVQRVAAKAVDRFFGDEARKFFDESGMGNHPAMLKGMFLVGKAISEDTTFEKGEQASKPKSQTEKFYGPQT